MVVLKNDTMATIDMLKALRAKTSSKFSMGHNYLKTSIQERDKTKGVVEIGPTTDAWLCGQRSQSVVRLDACVG